MDFPIFDGAFEIRARGSGRVLSGRFPYNRTATVRSSGRNRKERFKSGSLRWQVREFDKVQKELGAMVEGTADKVRRELLEDELERRNTFMLVGSFLRPGDSRHALGNPDREAHGGGCRDRGRATRR